ncbi:hypothetical protein ABT392_00795 [Paucibacter sp. JuS9]|uniref:hypothetical protein n=1 Tax=Paucibacter sp. JuS9 TaxID=3228748 RepID=UPI003757466A
MTKTPVVALLYLLLLAVLSSSAPAQTQRREAQIYRCGPEGRQLQDSPCSDKPTGTAQSVAFDQPSATQQREARERAAAERKQADRMEQERLQAEATQRKNQAAPGRIDGLASPAATPGAAASSPHAKPQPKKPKFLPQRNKSSVPAGASSAPR